MGTLLSYLALSCVSFVMFGYDKLAAQAAGRRIPEKLLLLVAFLGGWPGAIVAQQMFRHKTAKASFKRQFALVVGAHCLLILFWAGVRLPHIL